MAPAPKGPLAHMDALGWVHELDDACNTGWVKLRPDASGVDRVVAYHNEIVFARDLEQCRAQARADGWEV